MARDRGHVVVARHLAGIIWLDRQSAVWSASAAVIWS
jgi:hypothetical protein